MLRFLRGFNWRESEAHLLLLSRFASPKALADVAAPVRWRAILGEPPEQAVKRFIDEGVLSSLGNSGQRSAVGTAAFQWSPAGRDVVKQYLAAAKAKRAAAEQEVLVMLRLGRFREASKRVASYEAEQLLPPDRGLDRTQNSPARDMLVLTSIFGRPPSVLARLAEDKMEPLRLAAGMMYLWGEDSPEAWLPASYDTGLALDANAAAHALLLFSAQQAALVQFRQMGFIKAVRIEPCNDEDTCEACQRLADVTFSLSKVPDLPYEACTSVHGCRCSMVTVVDEP